LKKALSYLKPHGFKIVLIVFLIILQTFAELFLPRIMAQIVDSGILNNDIELVLLLGSRMLVLSLGITIGAVVVSYLIAKMATSAAYSIRKDLFYKIEHFSLTEFEKFSTSSLITRSTNDVQQVQMMFVMMFRMMIQAPIFAIGGFIFVFSQSAEMAWIFAILIPILVTYIVVIFLYAKPRFEKIQQLVDRINLIAREKLTGIRVIRAFNRQNDEVAKFEDTSQQFKMNSIRLGRVMATIQPIFTLLLSFSTIVIVWFSASLIDAGTMQVGSMMAFIQYTMQIMFSFIMLAMIFIFYPRAAVSAQRISEVLSIEPIIIDPLKPEQFCNECKGEIEFDNVSFRYPDAQEDVLQHINFTAKAGQTTAIIGSTGSGKSTLINLIPRFFDVTSGSIRIDGVNIKNVTQHLLRERIGFVPQKGVLFAGTIESNLRLANPEASPLALQQAIEISQSSDIISEKKEGLQSDITQGATNLSGGQKQRLSIARALIKNPEIYIFDDSFSALDFKTDKKLRQAIRSQLSQSTVIVVAQRVSTIMDADQIIVLEKGELVGIGKHKELLMNCPIYYQIASSQLSQEELA